VFQLTSNHFLIHFCSFFLNYIIRYDQKLYDDEGLYRINESLLLFDEICNSRWFTDTSIILFLNNTDLFKEKIAKVDIKVCFPEYDGGCNYELAMTFITNKFIELNKSEVRQIYPYLTCATSTDIDRFICTTVKDISNHYMLRLAGFL